MFKFNIIFLSEIIINMAVDFFMLGDKVAASDVE